LFLPGRFCNGSRFAFGLRSAPFMRTVAAVSLARSIGEPELVRAAELAISGAAALCDFYEPERDQLANGRGDSVPVNAIFLELLIRNRQLSVVRAGVMAQLDLDAR
jgi:hypothetical protein